MTNTLPPHRMYADTQVHFRDPFSTHDAYEDLPGADWSSYRQFPDFSRALTPPPDMNRAPQTSKPATRQQEYGQYHHDYSSSRSAYQTAASSHVPQEVSNSDFGRNGTASLPISPVTSRPAMVHDTLSQPQQRRASQANAIAPSFQIPKTVNDSGGSLSELAAEITCLFWFESWELLQQVEDSSLPIQLSRPLASDAKPTTGFRKWVTTILSTTLVAQNVVLLALLFIHRLKKMNPNVRGKAGSEYRLLTVALMLGNKFLDDNTYTNKTWAEVSGINVAEVHVMEVEFLSNMKYCLFTDAEDWAKWQTLLGKFAAFFERASRPQPPPPILPPASSLNLPMALPSPPASNQASPPYLADLVPAYGVPGQAGPTPAPSPLAYVSNVNASYQSSHKRSHDDHATEPPPKRQASGYQDYQSPHQRPNASSQNQQLPRLALPSLSIPNGQDSSSYGQSAAHSQHLPPLSVPSRAMAMVYPNAAGHVHQPQLTSVAGSSSQPQSQGPSQYQSRQQSPYHGSAAASPASAGPYNGPILPAAQVSPTYFLQQRNSPYRPVHNVSTLLYPPPSSATYHRPQNIEYNQMHYQPLGKPFQQRQSGRLPYVSQNVWLDGNHHQAMTPVHQWPSFQNTQHQQHLIPQQ